MKSYSVVFSAGVLSTSVLLVTLAGCSSESQPTAVGPATVATTPVASPAVPATTSAVENGHKKVADEEHLHKAGFHGGIIIPIGSDSYHAEAVIESNGVFRLLMPGKDETRIQDVDVQLIKACVKAIGDPNATPIELAAVPQDGDSPDKTSQFVGQSFFCIAALAMFATGCQSQTSPAPTEASAHAEMDGDDHADHEHGDAGESDVTIARLKAENIASKE